MATCSKCLKIVPNLDNHVGGHNCQPQDREVNRAAHPILSKPNPVGRPVERAGAKKGGYKLDKEDSDKLQRLAKACGRSVHDLASTALERWIKEQREPDSPDQLLINIL